VCVCVCVWYSLNTYTNLNVIQLIAVGLNLLIGHGRDLGHLNVKVLSERVVLLLAVIDLFQLLALGCFAPTCSTTDPKRQVE
jgi:hypothetical protein